MSVTVDGGGRSLTESEMQFFEKRLGPELPLPESYRKFLMEHNGGQPTPRTFDLYDGRVGSSVDEFYSVSGPERTTRLALILELLEGRIPPAFFPFACDSFGNELLLQCKGPGTGRVYFWDHEGEGPEGEPPTMSNMTLVAESFEAFLDGLYEWEP